MATVNLTDVLNGEDKVTIEAIVSAMSLSASNVVIDVKATEDILKGQQLAFSGYNLGLDAIEVALGDNTVGVSIGVATEDIALGESGGIISNGMVENFDTTAWTEGTILYVSTLGNLTSTEPTSGLQQPIGYVLKSNANVGSIMVTVDYPKQDAADVRFDATKSVADELALKASIADAYSHPTYDGDDLNIDTTTLSGATVMSMMDFNINTDTQGHVTDATLTGMVTRELTPADIGAEQADADIVKYDVAGLFTEAQRGHIDVGANALDFDINNNLAFAATATSITVTSQTVGQSGHIVATASENIT